MSPTNTNKILGVVLILGALAATVVLQLRHQQVPAIFTSVLTAAFGMVFPSMLSKGKTTATITATLETKNPSPIPPKP